MQLNRMTRFLISCGWIGPVLFTLVYTIDGATRPGYNPLQHWISHLSLGPRGWLNILNLFVFGCLMIGFSFGLRRAIRAGRGAKWGPIFSGLIGISSMAAGLFVIDPNLGYPPDSAPEQSWHGSIHDLCGAVLFGSLTALCFVLSRRFSGNGQTYWAVYSNVSGALVLLSFIACSVMVSLKFSGAVTLHYSGLLERISLMTGCAWITVFSIHLLSLRGRDPLHKPE